MAPKTHQPSRSWYGRSAEMRQLAPSSLSQGYCSTNGNCYRGTASLMEIAREERAQDEEYAAQKMYNQCCSWSSPTCIFFFFRTAWPLCSNGLLWRLHLTEVICVFVLSLSETLAFQAAGHDFFFFLIHEKERTEAGHQHLKWEVSICSVGEWICAVIEWIIKRIFTKSRWTERPKAARASERDHNRCLCESLPCHRLLCCHGQREAFCNK